MMISRYRLGPRLGAGAYAVVWLAHDESLDTMVAIKVMSENWVDQADMRERFLAEARMLRRAASNRIVQVFDVGELPDGRPYFVMEHADRGTLEDRVAQGRLPLVEALRVTAEVARGAAELHRLEIVHRDLKPSNVLIRSTPDGGERLLIADLGVAKNLAQGTARTTSVGSAGYMAPEQSTPDSRVDARADVYSLGALGFDLVTGRQPPTSGPVLPAGSDPDLPEPVRQVLQRALEPNRDRRWPDAASLADRLDELADEFDSRSSSTFIPPPGGERVSSGRGRARRVLLAVGLLIVMLGGAGFWELARNTPTELRPQGTVTTSDPAVGASPSPTVSELADGDHYGLLVGSGKGEVTVDLVNFVTGKDALAKCRKDFGSVSAKAVCGVFYVSKLGSPTHTFPVAEKADISYVSTRGDRRTFHSLAGADVAELAGLSKTYQQGRVFQFTLTNGVVDFAVQVVSPCEDIDAEIDGENEWTSECIQRSAE